MDSIAEQMRPMFIAARAGKMMFWCRYQDIWFTPDELESSQAGGCFRWGAVNWELRSEEDYLSNARQRIRAAQAEYDRRMLKLGRK